ncbi:MAG: nicotinate (nicotinamide) nucleotide adenylyltransferase [Melioribacteraceae bacterium]|nr:nicotinate (nicotinamide) nucleotide adenylyltransferase [Melioribacteraceae bacterium]
MAIGIYGGNFDPIHFGHLITAQRVLEIRNLEKIIFIPANISPLKQDVSTAAGEHRSEMVRIAISRNKNFLVSEIELERLGVSYTIDTLKTIKKKYNDIELIIGFDNLLKFDQWYKPEEILEMCKLIVLHRKV